MAKLVKKSKFDRDDVLEVVIRITIGLFFVAAELLLAILFIVAWNDPHLQWWGSLVISIFLSAFMLSLGILGYVLLFDAF